VQWGAKSRLQRFWDIRAALNFIGGGTGSSLLVWASVGLLAGYPYFAAALTGLAFVAGGLFMVWLEIGKPWRAFNLMFRPQTSWMTREGIVALFLFATGTIAVLFDPDFRLPVNTPSPLFPAFMTACLGLAFLYCQIRILHSARGLPAWREPRVMTLVALSGLVEGLGIYMLVLTISGGVPVFIAPVALTLIIARGYVWHTYITALTRSGAPQATISALFAMRGSLLIFGHVLPVVLITLFLVLPGPATPLLALAGIAATLGGWQFKAVLVTKAAYIPEYSIPAAPIRGQPGC
jgi:phenylacetyl-CoA:acceptor oxidoreductase subunit 2